MLKYIIVMLSYQQMEENLLTSFEELKSYQRSELKILTCLL